MLLFISMATTEANDVPILAVSLAIEGSAPSPIAYLWRSIQHSPITTVLPSQQGTSLITGCEQESSQNRAVCNESVCWDRHAID